jgi:hypothetical protein
MEQGPFGFDVCAQECICPGKASLLQFPTSRKRQRPATMPSAYTESSNLGTEGYYVSWGGLYGEIPSGKWRDSVGQVSAVT